MQLLCSCCKDFWCKIFKHGKCIDLAFCAKPRVCEHSLHLTTQHGYCAGVLRTHMWNKEEEEMKKSTLKFVLLSLKHTFPLSTWPDQSYNFWDGEPFSKVPNCIIGELCPAQAGKDYSQGSGQEPVEDKRISDSRVPKFFTLCKPTVVSAMRAAGRSCRWGSQMWRSRAAHWVPCGLQLWEQIGRTAKSSEKTLEKSYVSEMSIRLPGSSSGGHFCTPNAWTLKHLWHRVL